MHLRNLHCKNFVCGDIDCKGTITAYGDIRTTNGLVVSPGGNITTESGAMTITALTINGSSASYPQFTLIGGTQNASNSATLTCGPITCGRLISGLLTCDELETGPLHAADITGSNIELVGNVTAGGTITSKMLNIKDIDSVVQLSVDGNNNFNNQFRATLECGPIVSHGSLLTTEARVVRDSPGWSRTRLAPLLWTVSGTDDTTVSCLNDTSVGWVMGNFSVIPNTIIGELKIQVNFNDYNGGADSRIGFCSAGFHPIDYTKNFSTGIFSSSTTGTGFCVSFSGAPSMVTSIQTYNNSSTPATNTPIGPTPLYTQSSDTYFLFTLTNAEFSIAFINNNGFPLPIVSALAYPGNMASSPIYMFLCDQTTASTTLSMTLSTPDVDTWRANSITTESASAFSAHFVDLSADTVSSTNCRTGKLTSTGTISCGTNAMTSGALSCSSVTSTGTMSASSFTTAGSMQAASVTSTGTMSASSFTTAGSMQAASITSTGTMTCGTNAMTCGALSSTSVTTKGLTINDNGGTFEQLSLTGGTQTAPYLATMTCGPIVSKGITATGNTTLSNLRVVSSSPGWSRTRRAPLLWTVSGIDDVTAACAGNGNVGWIMGNFSVIPANITGTYQIKVNVNDYNGGNGNRIGFCSAGFPPTNYTKTFSTGIFSSSTTGTGFSLSFFGTPMTTSILTFSNSATALTTVAVPGSPLVYTQSANTYFLFTLTSTQFSINYANNGVETNIVPLQAYPGNMASSPIYMFLCDNATALTTLSATLSTTDVTSWRANSITSESTTAYSAHFVDLSADTVSSADCRIGNLESGPILATGTVSCGTNAMTCGALTASSINSTGTITCGTNAMTCGALTASSFTSINSTGTMTCGTNSMTCGALTSSSVTSKGLTINDSTATPFTQLSLTGGTQTASYLATMTCGPIVSKGITATGNTTLSNLRVVSSSPGWSLTRRAPMWTVSGTDDVTVACSSTNMGWIMGNFSVIPEKITGTYTIKVGLNSYNGGASGRLGFCSAGFNPTDYTKQFDAGIFSRSDTGTGFCLSFSGVPITTTCQTYNNSPSPSAVTVTGSPLAYATGNNPYFLFTLTFDTFKVDYFNTVQSTIIPAQTYPGNMKSSPIQLFLADAATASTTLTATLSTTDVAGWRDNSITSESTTAHSAHFAHLSAKTITCDGNLIYSPTTWTPITITSFNVNYVNSSMTLKYQTLMGKTFYDGYIILKAPNTFSTTGVYLFSTLANELPAPNTTTVMVTCAFTAASAIAQPTAFALCYLHFVPVDSTTTALYVRPGNTISVTSGALTIISFSGLSYTNYIT